MEAEVKNEDEVKAENVEQQNNNNDEFRIDGETLFTLPSDLQEQENNLIYRERKTRWGDRTIKRSKIQ